MRVPRERRPNRFEPLKRPSFLPISEIITRILDFFSNTVATISPPLYFISLASIFYLASSRGATIKNASDVCSEITQTESYVIFVR